MNAVFAPVTETDPRSIIAGLQALRQLPPTREALDRFSYLLRLLCRADTSVLVKRQTDGRWVELGASLPPGIAVDEQWLASIADVGTKALDKGFSTVPVLHPTSGPRIRLAIRVNGILQAVVVLELPPGEQSQLNELAVRALLAADFSADAANAPDVASFQPSALSVDALPDRLDDNGFMDSDDGLPAVVTQQTELLSVLDLAATVMQEKRFESALLALVNGLAGRLGAEQVAVGWLSTGKVQTRAISHLDSFDRHSDSVLLLEDAFEEAAVHDADVMYSVHQSLESEGDMMWPAHASLVGWIEMSAAMTLPLRDTHGITQAMVTLVFADDLPPVAVVEQIRLLLNIVEPWLHDLHGRDRHVWQRGLSVVTRGIETSMGPGHVLSKSLAILGSLLFLILVFGTWPFRIEASSQLTTDSTRVITAQFDGRLDEVNVTAGDEITENSVLASMDTRELRQQSAEIQAEILRYSAEADKARASGNLAEMEIALARQSQAVTRQERLAYYMEQATIPAPFDGVVVEGERKDLLGASVRKGDKLFRVARVEGLYLTLMVPERDIRHIQPNAPGRLQLLSRPDQTVRLRLANLIPVAQVKGQEGNHFMIKAELLDPPEAWWRPGMSGVVRIDAGDRNIGWILTHRLVDSLRLFFWW